MDERIYNRNRKWTRETFLDNFTVAEERHAARRLLDVARDSGAAFHWGPSGVSIRMRCSLWGNPVSVAWLYPPSTTDNGWMKTRDFSFGVAILDEAPPPPPALSTVLKQWADQFGAESFTTRVVKASGLPVKGVDAWSVNYPDAVQHLDLLSDRLANILTKLQSATGEPPTPERVVPLSTLLGELDADRSER